MASLIGQAGMYTKHYVRKVSPPRGAMPDYWKYKLAIDRHIVASKKAEYVPSVVPSLPTWPNSLEQYSWLVGPSAGEPRKRAVLVPMQKQAVPWLGPADARPTTGAERLPRRGLQSLLQPAICWALVLTGPRSGTTRVDQARAVLYV